MPVSVSTSVCRLNTSQLFYLSECTEPSFLNAQWWPCRSGYRRRREAKVCRSLLQKLKDEQATAVRNQQYPATSCPICFEDLAKPDAAPDSPSASGAGMAGAYKGDQSSSRFGASSSSKSDVAPSAPPLETRSEYESLLGKDRETPGHQDEHKHIRWVRRQTFVDTLVENEAVLLQNTACQVVSPMRA